MVVVILSCARIPPICIFPYNVYSKINTASTQIWEAVKSSTQVCMLHGGL